MSARHPIVLAAVTALAFLSGAARAQNQAGLGTDLAGESCTFGPPGGTEAGLRGFPVACGDAASSGSLYVMPGLAKLPDAPDARRDAIVAAAKQMPVGLGLGAEINCGTGSPLAEGSEYLFFACTERSDGWPRIVLVLPAGGTLYQAQGMPALLPVLEAAIASRSGRALSPGETEAALRLLERHFPGALAHAGGADAASERALVELARLDGAQRNFAAAETAYRRALELETRLFGANAASVGQSLMELALEVSNQGRFDEAAGLFRRAQPIIEASASVSARARLQSYLALDAANQRHYEDALKYAREATSLRRAELNAQAPAAGAGEGQAPASRGELAHSLRIEAAMAMKLGDLPDALAAAEEVLSIVSDEPGLPLWWRPDAIAMMAEINTQDGRVVEAERQFRDALVLDEKLFGETAPTAFAGLRLGRFYADQQLYPAAVAVFRRALAILAQDDVARAAILPDQIVPFLAADSIAANRGEEAATRDAEMFRASQLVGSDVVGRTIARTAARLASSNPALAELTRTAQDAQRRRDEARIELAAETAKSDDQRDPAREKTRCRHAGSRRAGRPSRAPDIVRISRLRQARRSGSGRSSRRRAKSRRARSVPLVRHRRQGELRAARDAARIECRPDRGDRIGPRRRRGGTAPGVRAAPRRIAGVRSRSLL